mgnify:CR=1 FL=1
MTTQIPVRVAGAQIPVTTDVSTNVITIKAAIDYAVENECDYLVTPEGSLSGYSGMFGFNNAQIGMPMVRPDPFHNIKELTEAMGEVESYAKDKVGLCLGTVWQEQEDYSKSVGRNQIRFYKKSGEIVGATNKTYCVVPQDLPFKDHEIDDKGVQCWQLGEDTFKFNAVGLICNDMWGHGWSGGQMIPWVAKQQYNMNGREDCQILIHATNGFRGMNKKMKTLFDNWHHSHLTMMSHLCEIPIITVDNCWHMDGIKTEDDTSSESGVLIKGEFVTKIPRQGTQYFYHDFFGITYE